MSSFRASTIGRWWGGRAGGAGCDTEFTVCSSLDAVVKNCFNLIILHFVLCVLACSLGGSRSTTTGRREARTLDAVLTICFISMNFIYSLYLVRSVQFGWIAIDNRGVSRARKCGVRTDGIAPEVGGGVHSETPGPHTLAECVWRERGEQVFFSPNFLALASITCSYHVFMLYDIIAPSQVVAKFFKISYVFRVHICASMWPVFSFALLCCYACDGFEYRNTRRSKRYDMSFALSVH